MRSFREAGRHPGPPHSLPNDAADLELEFTEEALHTAPFRHAMLGIDAPCVKRLLGFKLDNRYPLAIVRDETFVRDVAGHRARQLTHALRHRAIFVLCPRIHSGT